jgi:phosphate transport system substrate-binding protein
MVIATRGFSQKESLLISDSLKVNPKQQTIAYDAIAVIVNPAAKDSMFSIPELKDLLTGKSKKNLIPVFDGLKATSTVRFMLDSVLRGEMLGSHVVAAENSEGVINYVASTPNAVGLIGVSWIANTEDSTQSRFLKKIRVARLESTDSANNYVLPVQLFIYTRGYPLIRSLVYSLKEKYYGLGSGFASFLVQDRGQLIFRRAYLFPAFRAFYTRDAELQQD